MAEGENKPPLHLKSAGFALSARQTDLIRAAWRRGGLSGRQPVSSQPNTYLSRHIHLAAVHRCCSSYRFPPQATKPHHLSLRSRNVWLSRCRDIYINTYKRVVATRYEPQPKAVLTSPRPSHTSATLICHPARKNTQAARWERRGVECGSLPTRTLLGFTSVEVGLPLLGETLCC